MEFRSLRENELKEWTAFCGSIFPVGEAYFMRHFANDPYRDINGIFISRDETGLTSSVRVFKDKGQYHQGGRYRGSMHQTDSQRNGAERKTIIDGDRLYG